MGGGREAVMSTPISARMISAVRCPMPGIVSSRSRASTKGAIISTTLASSRAIAASR